MTISFRAFADELVKIAEEEEERLYAPGIVAHEAGHARVHGPTARDMALQYGRFGAQILTGRAMRDAKTPKERRDAFIAGNMAHDVLQLGDEYASSIIAMKKLKDEGKLTKGQLAHEGIRLTSAGLGYASSPAAKLNVLTKDPEVRKKVVKGIMAGRLASSGITYTHTGPKITASEAKQLVEGIAPGTRVYASDKPISGGSVYMNKSYTPIGKALVYLTTRAMGMRPDDSREIASKGGVIVAPVAPVANIGLSMAQGVAQDLVPQIPLPPLTLPRGRIRRIRSEGEE